MRFSSAEWDDAIVVAAGKLRKLWDSLSELHSYLRERRLERTVLRLTLLPVKTAQFTQFFGQLWRHTVKSLSLRVYNALKISSACLVVKLLLPQYLNLSANISFFWSRVSKFITTPYIILFTFITKRLQRNSAVAIFSLNNLCVSFNSQRLLLIRWMLLTYWSGRFIKMIVQGRPNFLLANRRRYLWAGSRAARVKITVRGTPNLQNYCVFFYGIYKFRNVAEVGIKKTGGGGRGWTPA